MNSEARAGPVRWTLAKRLVAGMVFGALLAVGGELRARSEGQQPMSLIGGIAFASTFGGLAGGILHVLNRRRREGWRWHYISWTVSAALAGVVISTAATIADRRLDLPLSAVLVFFSGALGFAWAFNLHWIAGESERPW